MIGCYRPQRSLARRACLSLASFAAALLAGAFLSTLSPGDAAAENAGRTTAVVQQARSTPPGQETRVLRPKLDVFLNERIQTDERGVTQILFVDGTNLTVGPGSDLFIDRFVYDPDTSTGELVARLGGGVLRFVGGQVSKRGKVEISTPVAVVGVRGGIAVVEHDEGEGTGVVFLFGDQLTVTGLGLDELPRQTKIITRAGFATTVSADGGVADAAPVDAEKLSAALGALEAKEDTTSEERAGAPEADRETIAEAASDYTEEAGSALPGLAAWAGAQDGRPVPDAAEETVKQADAPLSPPALWVYDVADSNVRYSLPAMLSSQSQRHPFTVVKREGSARDNPYRAIYVRSRFVNTDQGQEATVFVTTGYIGLSDNYAGVRLLTRTAGSVRDPSRIHNGRAATFVSYYNGLDLDRRPSPAFNGKTPPETFTTTGEVRFDGQRRISVLPQNYWTDVDGDGNDDDGVYVQSGHFSDPFVEYRLNEPVRPVTHYGPRNDGIWKGYATGLFEGWNTDGEDFIYVMGNRGNSPDDVNIHRDTQYSILGASFGLGHMGGNSGGVNSMLLESGRFAGQEDRIRSVHARGDSLRVSTTRGTYLSDDVFAAQDSLAYWGDNTRAQSLIWVNGELIQESGSGVSPTRTWLFSNAAAPADGLLPTDVEFCRCPAARFGWWGGRISYQQPHDEAVERRDDVFPGSFVVGLLPETADIPTVGTASYSGHAGAAINNGSTTYAAVGGFGMDWNFGTRTGTANITDLDGRNYRANDLTAPLANPRDFASAGFEQSGGSGTGSITGSFFSNGRNPVVDVGGQFTVTDGSSYTATGSFAATSQ